MALASAPKKGLKTSLEISVHLAMAIAKYASNVRTKKCSSNLADNWFMSIIHATYSALK